MAAFNVKNDASFNLLINTKDAAHTLAFDTFSFDWVPQATSDTLKRILSLI